MDEELEKLSNLGVQKIYEDTHIPAQHIQAILHSSFDGFSKVQFLGFISILEREYSCQLLQLRSLGLEHFKEKKARLLDDGLVVMPPQRNTKLPMYLSVTIIILIAAVFINFFIFDEDVTSHHVIENSLIENVQKNIIKSNKTPEKEEPLSNVVDRNESNTTSVLKEEIVDSETALIEDKQIVSSKDQNRSESFKIVPRSKVWFGYIDVKEHKKHQATLADAMNLDANKTWLLLFGHGYIDMYVNAKVQKFDSRNKRRFFYKKGILTSISSEEFKTLARGLKW